MRHEQPIDTQAENSISSQKKKDVPQQTRPDDGGSNWQFKFVMTVIGLGVLGLILKTLGLF
jgi:hypothetical protein